MKSITISRAIARHEKLIGNLQTACHAETKAKVRLLIKRIGTYEMLFMKIELKVN